MSRKNRSSRRTPRNKNKVWYDINEEFNYDNNRSDRKRANEFLQDEDLKKLNRRINRQVILTPRGENQKIYVDNLLDPDVYITFGIGPAGSGKTMLAAQVAIKLLLEEKIEKIVITRPAVSVDEEHGFLPGNLNAKLAPWVQPIIDVFEEHFSPKEVQEMIKNKQICVEPLAFMRGRTFKNSFIIGDELQNSIPSQMKMLLTRIGEGSHMVITGDLNQHDRTFEKNGLLDFITKLEKNSRDIDTIRVCRFNKSDIQRHAVINDILNLYGEND